LSGILKRHSQKLRGDKFMYRDMHVYHGSEMKLLRDLRLSTKLLILIEVTTGSYSKLRQIADKLDITIQGVSEYMRIMHEEGLIQRINGEYRATKKGVQFLHENIRELKEFVDRTLDQLDIVEMCAAVAKTPIKKGEKVGLFMENGILAAYTDRVSRSTGIAVSDAQAGDDVPVRDLEGMVDLCMGRLAIVELPSIRDGGTHGVQEEEIKTIYSNFNPDKIGALDIVGRVLLNKLGIACDFEFAPISAVIEAVQRGLNVMVMGSSDTVCKMIALIDEMNTASMDKIEYELISLVK
jgi:putative transcriptional regulator